jgi:hypothetical protein
MVTVVVVINLAVALMLVYVAWRVWQLRLQQAQVADILSTYERSIHAGLRGAPKAIATARLGIHTLRQGSLPPDLQLLRLQQVLTLLGIGQQIWQRSRLVRRSRFFKRALAKYKYR